MLLVSVLLVLASATTTTQLTVVTVSNDTLGIRGGTSEIEPTSGVLTSTTPIMIDALGFSRLDVLTLCLELP